MAGERAFPVTLKPFAVVELEETDTFRQSRLKVVVRLAAEPGFGATFTRQLEPAARFEVPQVSETITKLAFDSSVGALQLIAWVDPEFVMVKSSPAPVSPTPIQP